MGTIFITILKFLISTDFDNPLVLVEKMWSFVILQDLDVYGLSALS